MSPISRKPPSTPTTHFKENGVNSKYHLAHTWSLDTLVICHICLTFIQVVIILVVIITIAIIIVIDSIYWTHVKN